MARAATTLLNSVTVNAGYAYGANATKTDLSASTSAKIAIEITVTNGASALGLNEHLRVYYTFSNVNLADAATAPTQLQSNGYKDILLPRAASAVTVYEVADVPFGGNYIYVWLETINLSKAITVKVDAINL